MYMYMYMYHVQDTTHRVETESGSGQVKGQCAAIHEGFLTLYTVSLYVL